MLTTLALSVLLDKQEISYGFDPTSGNQRLLWMLVSFVAVVAVIATRLRNRGRTQHRTQALTGERSHVILLGNPRVRAGC